MSQPVTRPAGIQADALSLGARIAELDVLIVDDEHYMRKVVRTLLMSIGVRKIREAVDGLAGLEEIRLRRPDVVIVDWEMPGLDGAGFVRLVRSPDSFPHPDVPIIMLTGHGERSRVIKAIDVGINEFLLKPVSTKALHTHLAAIVTNPRPMIRRGSYYGPAPRQPASVAATMDDGPVDYVYVN